MEENGALLYAFCIAICMSLGALGIFVWSVLSDQWEDAEESKYRFLEKEMDNDHA
jgi:cbb3-type cytochrome oxidase maturation protein